MLIQADLVITKDGEDTTTPLPLARIFQQYQECGIAEIFIEEQLELLRSAERSGKKSSTNGDTERSKEEGTSPPRVMDTKRKNLLGKSKKPREGKSQAPPAPKRLRLSNEQLNGTDDDDDGEDSSDGSANPSGFTLNQRRHEENKKNKEAGTNSQKKNLVNEFKEQAPATKSAGGRGRGKGRKS